MDSLRSPEPRFARPFAGSPWPGGGAGGLASLARASLRSPSPVPRFARPVPCLASLAPSPWPGGGAGGLASLARPFAGSPWPGGGASGLASLARSGIALAGWGLAVSLRSPDLGSSWPGGALILPRQNLSCPDPGEGPREIATPTDAPSASNSIVRPPYVPPGQSNRVWIATEPSSGGAITASLTRSGFALAGWGSDSAAAESQLPRPRGGTTRDRGADGRSVGPQLNLSVPCLQPGRSNRLWIATELSSGGAITARRRLR